MKAVARSLIVVSTCFIFAILSLVVVQEIAPAKAQAQRVYIDAGHGGGDSGAIGSGYREFDLTSELSNLVGDALSTYYPSVNYYVNTSGINYTLRADDAVSKGCDSFVSIHFNSASSSTATGTESYVYATSSKRHANSIQLQNVVHNRLVSATGLTDRGKKQADFTVCRAPMPSTLLEIAFISNANDMRLYQLYKQNIAYAIAQGIAEFVGENASSDTNGSWVKVNDRWTYQNNGKIYTDTWICTNLAPGETVSGSYERYYVGSDGYIPLEGAYELTLADKKSWFYVTAQGKILRGFYDNNAARVFVADNDGRLAEPQEGEVQADGSGWLISGGYTGGNLQRYYIDGASHAAKSAMFEVDGKKYFGQGGVGYCFRNGVFDWEGKTYSADNDGVLTDITTKWEYENGQWVYYENGSIVKSGWAVTGYRPGEANNTGLQRYYFDENGHMLAEGTYNLDLVGTKSWFYVTAQGYVLRGFYDNNAARVFVADNDGRIAEPQAGELREDGSGWLISGTYTNGDLQRYYIDGETHAAKSAIFEVDGKQYFGQGGVGYCLRNAVLDWEGKTYWANNDGVLSTYVSNGIMGTSTTSVAQMVRRWNQMGKTFPSDVYTKYGASNITEFCQILLEEANAEEVRAEVVFAQAMHETGWLQFGGDVSAEQCNFAGIGATGGVPGNSFNTHGTNSVRIGLRAQVQHLKAYASTLPLNNECVDPRFNYVTRGCATTVDALGGKWATGAGYGQALKNQINNLLAA